MVCDAFGLPHSAVGLARHLSANAELTHGVKDLTIERLTEQRDAAEARLLAVGTSLDRVEERAHMSPYYGGPRSTLLDAIADVRAALADSGE